MRCCTRSQTRTVVPGSQIEIHSSSPLLTGPNRVASMSRVMHNPSAVNANWPQTRETGARCDTTAILPPSGPHEQQRDSAAGPSPAGTVGQRDGRRFPGQGIMRAGQVRGLAAAGTRATAAERACLLPTPTASPYGRNRSPSPGASVRPSLASLLLQASGARRGGEHMKSAPWDVNGPPGSDPGGPRESEPHSRAGARSASS
jgi:hypothetical protein